MGGTPCAEMLKLIYVFFAFPDWDFSCPGLLYNSALHIIGTLGRSMENGPPVIPGKRGWEVCLKEQLVYRTNLW